MRVLTGILCVFALIAVGCGTTAEVRMRDGRLFDGKIQYGDDEAIYVGDGNAKVLRSEIVDIDHPGNGVLVTGICIGGYGVLNAAFVLSDENASGAYIVGGLTPLAVGLGMTIWGAVVWAGSTDAVKPRGKRYGFAPLVLPSPDGTLYGAATGFEF